MGKPIVDATIFIRKILSNSKEITRGTLKSEFLGDFRSLYLSNQKELEDKQGIQGHLLVQYFHLRAFLAVSEVFKLRIYEHI